MHALEHFDAMKEQPYNVGLSGANLSNWNCVPRFASKCQASSSSRPRSERIPTSETILSPTPSSRPPGSEPRYLLDAGIEELIKGYTIFRNSKYDNL